MVLCGNSSSFESLHHYIATSLHRYIATSLHHHMNYWDIFINGYRGYANYLWYEITHPSWNNYFYWLILVSAFFFAVELLAPWRRDQARFRKDFWLDFFYMFFNFFLFSLIIYNAASEVVVNFFNQMIRSISGFDLQANNPLRFWPLWAILLLGFCSQRLCTMVGTSIAA